MCNPSSKFSKVKWRRPSRNFWKKSLFRINISDRWKFLGYKISQLYKLFWLAKISQWHWKNQHTCNNFFLSCVFSFFKVKSVISNNSCVIMELEGLWHIHFVVSINKLSISCRYSILFWSYIFGNQKTFYLVHQYILCKSLMLELTEMIDWCKIQMASTYRLRDSAKGKRLQNMFVSGSCTLFSFGMRFCLLFLLVVYVPNFM